MDTDNTSSSNTTASISSWSWRHRFYAFLLRRALGPLLSAKSRDELQQSISNVDWSTGELQLVNVELDPTYLTNIIQGNSSSEGDDTDDTNDTEQKNNIAVHYACIRKFAVHISVCDIESTSTSSSSTARKATSIFLQGMFGSNDTTDDSASSSMALKVHVKLEGIDIILAPKQSATKMEWSTTYKQPPTSKSSDNISEQNDTTAQQQPGFFTSLVDSAMKSLRLSIDISDLKVSVYSKYHNNNAADGISVNYVNEEATCVTLNIASARYYDLIESKQVSSDNRRLDEDSHKPIEDEVSTTEKIVISKAFDWEKITIQTSSTSSVQEKSFSTLATNTPCLQSSGMGKLRFRIYEKWSSNNTFISARQGIEVSLGEQLSIELDSSSLTNMIDIVNAITKPLGDDYGDFVDAYEDDMGSKTLDESSTVLKEEESDNPDQHLLTDEFSRETYDAIMKQYTEARHLARTQELRGGLLIPSFNGENGDTHNDTDDISFDAFFDANDHSLSYYNSMLDENINMQHSDEDSKLNGEKKHNRSIEQTKLEIGLAEFTIKVNVGTSSSTEEEAHQSEYILLSMGDLRVLAFRSKEESKLNCSLSHFDIESQVFDCQHTLVNAPILRFLDESEGGFGNGLLLSSPPCVSLMAEFLDRNDEDRNTSVRVDIALQPLEITYQETAFQRLSNVIAELSQLEAPLSPKEEDDDDKAASSRDVHLAVSCSSAVLLLPCQQVPKILFQRHGYKDQASGGNTFVGIGLEVDNITLDVSHKSHHDGDNGTSSDESATMTCTQSIIFVKGIELEQGRRRNRKTITYQRADLVSLVGDVDSETPISISFSKFVKSNSQQKSVFPIILPLSSTKARQYEDESDEDDIDNVHAVEEATPNGMQTSDPQFILSLEANEAKSELVVNLPNILFDFTTCEKQELSNLLSSLISDNKESSDDDYGNETKCNTIGIGINVGQLSVVLHPSQPNESSSYSIIMDRIQIHALFRNSGLRNIRVLSHDVTLYELSNFCQPFKGIDCPISCSERCKKIQARLTKTSSTLARAILLRQKLCKPMSLDTPSFQIDVLIRGDNNCAESSVYMNVYDMSYRYIINSEWMQNLTALIKGVDKPETDSSIEDPASLMNLFVTITDCQMDYTPPITLRTASRIIVRLGELRFSSNIVTPAATVQAYKLALADMNVHICNYRHSYNEENALLSCAHRLLNDDDIFIPEKAKCLKSVVGIDDALYRMGFVNIVGLDTLDAIIFKSNTNGRNDCRKKNEPAISITLTLGRLTVNACHDSFSCLNSTYNEWFIKTTTLSEEELNVLKKFDAQSEFKTTAPPIKQSKEDTTTEVAHQSMNTKASTSSIENQERDDKVSLDLTKSLLFQNYYTFDAKTNRHATIQVQESEDIIKQSEDDLSASSDDEWNTIEHDFIQHSTIPQEQDFAAEWIVCDEPPANVPTSDAFQSTLSQTVKVYPQHIPVKPVLDPFNGGNKVDTAKLAGTSDAPEIGLRLIVKDGSIHFRFFDGFDWIADAPTFHQKKPKPKDRKEALLSSLIGGGDDSGSSDTRLDIAPLPEERNRNLQRDIVRRRLKRNPNKYFQLSFDGVKLKNDSFSQSKHHLLASRLDLSITDFMVVETISSSSGDHVKMMGEWFNESIHPRDDSDGIIMLQMTTKHPRQRVSSDGKLMSDESRATLELLPLRCYFNQNALRFVRNFFSGNHSLESEGEGDDDAQGNSDDTQIEDDEIVQIFFESFSVRPVRLKVDYQPENMDVDSFKEGNYIELLNICPLEEMVLNLQPVQMQDLTGWGSVLGELASKWIEDICNTQSHKFFTRASPFQPFSNLSDPLLDLAMVLVVPEGSTSAYLKSIIGGTTHLASKVVLEALSTSAKLTKFAAKAIPSKVKGSLPRRPKSVPRHAGDSMSHAYESMTSGLREANYKIVTIPLKEYQRSGASGAATAAVKGIPIGIIAPLAGASEALSYTLLGLRNQLQPDVRREEEASLRGLPS